jgi:hypothetical protein
VLPDFASNDGQFDLVVHFHGGTDLVAESFGTVGLDAALVVLNVGMTADSYKQRIWSAKPFTDLVERAEQTMRTRGLRDASVRRVALSAFSAGFGAVERILDSKGASDSIDAVLLLDGIHTAYVGHHELDTVRLEPFVNFARAAARNEKLFVITHSEIRTIEYASTSETTDYLLNVLGIQRELGGETPAMPDLAAMGGPSSRRNLRALEPLSHGERGGFRVRGYAGEGPENHMSHLNQMSTTALPMLAERWRPDSR